MLMLSKFESAYLQRQTTVQLKHNKYTSNEKGKRKLLKLEVDKKRMASRKQMRGRGRANVVYHKK